MLPITIVCASRHCERDFYSNSALGRSLSQTYSYLPVKKLVYFENTRPLPVCYNEAVLDAANQDEIFIFVHDDVLIADFFWIDKIQFGFHKFDILGVAGNKRRAPKQSAWASLDGSTWDDLSNLTGIIGHGRSFSCQLSIYGPSLQECKLMDGVLLSVKKVTFEKHGIKFDERFDFHFYDLDLCRQAEQHGVRMGTIPFGIIHESEGYLRTPSWKENYQKYLAKWGE